MLCSSLVLGLLLVAGSAPHTAFHPGQLWLDTSGVHLNAHGFCVLDFGGRHYWYGSHKIAGKTEDEKNEAGIRCYVSDDLMNWHDQGLVLSVFAPHHIKIDFSWASAATSSAP